MPLLSFHSYSLWLNALIFLFSAGLIWGAGTFLERDADALSERTGLGQAFTGLLLLSTATSLPEVTTTITAVAFLQNPTLAVYNLLGGVALQTGILALADWAKRRAGALTYFRPRFVLLLQGVGLLLLLQLTIAGITAHGRPVVVSVSVWTVAVFLVYLGTLYMTYRYRGHPRWTPTKADDVPREENPAANATGDRQNRSDHEDRAVQRPVPRLWLRFAGASLVVLIAGWVVAQSADTLADQTGLGDAFLGATFLALATSLPEVSTTVAASRNGRFSLAISNIFGSNAFCVGLLFLAELLYRGGTILEQVKESVVFVTAIGALMTSIYLCGMLERQDRTVLGVGWDSAAAVTVYLGGMAVLYYLG
ncbi:MAG: sodium:calcium antiporter [Thermodesulfobacteriota bacterium]|jgi:cation:H+ antiporter